MEPRPHWWEARALTNALILLHSNILMTCMIIVRLGPVSQKYRNFLGLFRMPQFPLHLREAEALLSNFAIRFLFLTLKTWQKLSFSKQVDCSLTTGFSAPNRSRDSRETGHRPGFLEAWLKLTGVNYHRNV